MEASPRPMGDRAVRLADIIGAKFAEQKFGSRFRRVVRLVDAEPDPTTGRTRVRQSIVLLPDPSDPDGAGEARAIECGWFDGFRRAASLKSYTVVSQAYLERHRMPIDLSRAEYAEVIEALLGFLRTIHVDARMSSAARVRKVQKRPKPALTPRVREHASIAIGGAAIGFSLCYLLFAFGVF
jgi:hypothetical protein